MPEILEEEEEHTVEPIKEENLGNTLFGKYVVAQDVVTKTQYNLKEDDLLLTGDKKLINSFIDSRNSQLFVLTKKGFVVYEMFNWIEYVNKAISENKIMFGMKMINFLLD